ncbi:MAG: CDP-glucose 4,6-dehydratase [Alphaproteobacteria bacterium]|nr:CDP-glucose 4,6-dehydratase [Alphaproteobacteria bacterium]
MSFWQNRHVLVTGHTGFIGGWLSWQLIRLGARVSGISLPPPDHSPSLFALTALADNMAGHHLIDLRDATATEAALANICTTHGEPSIVLHLAAQPLVRAAFADPVGNFATNVMGTAHLLQNLRHLSKLQAVVVMTTDKVYLNREWVWDYREDDALGGYEPYGCSKAAQEMVAAAYRSSYFLKAPTPIGLATVRAGNVIGGGDFADDRIIPDLVRAVRAGQPLAVRSPQAVRPWQHVIAVVDGLLHLTQSLAQRPTEFSQAWNFGPPAESVVPVAELVAQCCHAWNQTAPDPQGGGQLASWQNIGDPNAPYEATLLDLSSRKAHQKLGWHPRWGLAETIEQTIAWYHQWSRGASTTDLGDLCLQQLAAYDNDFLTLTR